MTYPEMNEKLVAILRISDDPSKLYAADRIEELERENASLLANGREQFDTLQARLTGLIGENTDLKREKALLLAKIHDAKDYLYSAKRRLE